MDNFRYFYSFLLLKVFKTINLFICVIFIRNLVRYLIKLNMSLLKHIPWTDVYLHGNT